MKGYQYEAWRTGKYVIEKRSKERLKKEAEEILHFTVETVSVERRRVERVHKLVTRHDLASVISKRVNFPSDTFSAGRAKCYNIPKWQLPGTSSGFRSLCF